MRRALALVAMAGLFWLTWVSASYVWADAAILRAAGDVASIAEAAGQNGRVPSYAEWKAVRDTLVPAHETDEANPNLWEVEGNHYSLLVRDGEQYRGFAAEQIDAFSRAVALRPVSAFTWMELAQAKYRAGQVDALFYRALANAVRLGPNEPPLQLAVADLGFALWDEMPAALRESVRSVMLVTVRRQGDAFLGVAERRGRLEIACGMGKLGNMAACRSYKGAQVQSGN